MSSASDRRNSGGGGDGGGEGANWMDTYGDLVTLLLTFFVLLFAFSSVDAEKWEALVGAFTGSSVVAITPLSPEMAIERPIQPISDMPITSKENKPLDPEDPTEAPSEATVDASLWELYENMLAYVEENNIQAEIVLLANEYMIIMRFNDQVFFRSGDANILPESRSVLDKVIQMFSDYSDLYAKLSIEGHTDNVPISTGRYPSNWELSIDRALNVQRYINAAGIIDPMRLKLGGYGEYDPIADNDTPEGRAKNRRVDFVVEVDKPR